MGKIRRNFFLFSTAGGTASEGNGDVRNEGIDVGDDDVGDGDDDDDVV